MFHRFMPPCFQYLHFPCLRFHPSRLAVSVPLMLAVLLGSAALSGCGNNADDTAAPSLTLSADTPTHPPPTPALFAAAAALPPPDPQVSRALLPPRPPDPSQVAAQAVGQVAANAPAAPVNAGLAVNAGLIVCDPVPASADPALAVFGTACGRWLDLVAAGQPELGRTPFWEARGRCRKEMHRTDFTLTPAQAAPLAAMAGATHAACGTLSGTPVHCTLTYTLNALPGGKPVGLPLVFSGTEQQVAAALPSLARALDKRLGVAAPRLPVPPSASPSAADLVQTETIADQDAISDADLLTLSRLSMHSPLAGMYALNTRAADDQLLLNRLVKTLLTQMPGNTLVLSHIGYIQTDALRPYAAATRALIRQYPASALLAHTDAWQQRVWGDRAGEWQAACQVCRDAPADPASWLTRAATLANIGGDLRQGRVVGDLSAADWTALNRLYAQQEAANVQAARLDSADGHAWYALAEAATFYGDAAQADAAFRKALVLDTDKSEVYSWGLQMYQPKWGGDPAELARIAALAAAEPWDDSASAVYIAEDLDGAGFHAEAAQVLSGFVARQRAVIAKSPTDLLGHWSLAAALAAQKTPDSLREATLEYRTAAHLMPNAPAIHRWLADVLDQRHRGTEAIAEYRAALALNPFAADTHFALGMLLKRRQQFAAARPELNLTLRLDPRNAEAHYGLGEILVQQHHYKPAAAEMQEAIRMSFYSINAWISLPSMLDEIGQYDGCLQAGREADHVVTEQRDANSETEPFIHNAMADADLHKKAWASSLAETHVSLSYSPNDPVAHENLAEAYSGQGKIDAARAEWKRTIALGNPEVTPVAQKLLAAHP